MYVKDLIQTSECVLLECPKKDIQKIMSGSIQELFGEEETTAEEIEKHYGTVDISKDEVTAGAYETWTITYTVGQFGVDDGARIKIATNQTSDWGRPQFENPQEENYGSVSTDSEATVEARFDRLYQNPKPWGDNIIIDIYDGYLAEGDTVTLTLGDRSEGSPGHRIQSFPETAFHFMFQIDMQGTGDYLTLEELDYEIVAGEATTLQTFAPSIVEPGEPTEVVVRALDYFGNTARDFSGTLQVELTDDDADFIGAVNMDDSVAFIPVEFKTPGVHRVTITDTDRDWSSTSNPLRCDPQSEHKIHWGDIHGQSGKTVGTGTIDEYFQFARDEGMLDFTSHCANDFQVDEEYWNDIKDAIRKYHKPGEHVTLLANEWSANTVSGGDHNVYYRNTDEPLVASGSWQDGEGFKKHEGVYPIEDLYEYYEGRDDVLIFPHQGGRPARLRDPEDIDASLTTLVEINSIWGVFEWLGHEAIERGYKIGFTCGSDDHTGRLGAARPTSQFTVDEKANLQAADFNVKGGLTGAKMEDLTRESLWDALSERRCYGTTGERILLDVDLDGNEMGEEATIDVGTSFSVEAFGTAPIKRVDLFDGAEIIDSIDLTDGDDLLEFTWSGARSNNRHKLLEAHGALSLSKGAIEDATEFGFDHPDQGITRLTTNAIEWDSTISGNYQGVKVDLEAPEDATLSYSVPFLDETFELSELDDETIIEVEEYLDVQLAIRRVGEATEMDVELDFDLSSQSSGEHAYYVRVVQEDGGMAWSSPIYATVE